MVKRHLQHFLVIIIVLAQAHVHGIVVIPCTYTIIVYSCVQSKFSLLELYQLYTYNMTYKIILSSRQYLLTITNMIRELLSFIQRADNYTHCSHLICFMANKHVNIYLWLLFVIHLIVAIKIWYYLVEFWHSLPSDYH